MAMDSGTPEDYSPYAQLVAALLPRAQGLTIFSTAGEPQWTSEDTVPPSLPPLVKNLAAEAAATGEPGQRAQLAGDVPVYLFWLRNDQGELKSVFSIGWRAGEADSRTFAYVHAMLKPVLECLRRELLLRADLAGRPAVAAPGADTDDADLQVLLSTADAERREGGGDIALLLQNINRHMQCEFTALIVPERNLVMMARAEGRSVDTSVLAKLHRHLLSLAQVRSDALIVNDPASLPGVSLPFRALVSAIRNPAGRPSGVLALFRSLQAPEFRRRDGLLADLLSRRASVAIDSNYDTLTGLFTRKAFEQRARLGLDQNSAGRRMRWSCLYIDTDRMHVVNDNYGMHVGDQLLAKLGELIRSRLVPGALAARVSGDRFAILLPTDEDDAGQFAEALRESVEAFQPAHLGATADGSFQASISIGVAGIADSRVDIPHATAIAETACKAAKDRGRNRVEIYQSSDVSIMRRYEDVNIAPSLRAAMNENRMRLDAQLIAPLPGNASSVPHFELLLRMIDERGETVGPNRFLSAAIRYQLMPAVDRWVIQEALRLLSPHATLLADCPVVFTINLSGQSLGDADFVDRLIGQIRESRIEPRVLCFELTESAAIANLASAEVMMKRLRELGCGVALDDFGTGLSSLAYLRALPVDMLKIDGSFVRDVLKDPRAESMVQAIAQLARSMNLTTVAEYVETDEIRLRVAKLGVDYGQGFAIARPVPLTDTIRELPAYASAARQRHSEEIVLGSDDDTISAELQQELTSELLADGIELPDDEMDEAQRRMERILEGYDHTESTLYQRKIAG